MLDAHRELAIPAETQFVPELLEREAECQGPGELVDIIVGARTWHDFGLDEEAFRAAVSERGAWTAPDVLHVFYGLCAEREGKPRWGDKTPGYVEADAARSPHALAEARFVHLIRDGRDVAPVARRARDGRRASRSATSPSCGSGGSRARASRPSGCAVATWSSATRTWSRDAEAALRRVCELIELEFDPAMLELSRAGRARGSPSSATSGPPANGPSAHRRRAAGGARADQPSRRRAAADRRSGASDMSAADREPVRGRGGRPARRARLRRAILTGPLGHRLSTTRSGCSATAACAAAPSRRLQPRSWSASAAPARRCCG